MSYDLKLLIGFRYEYGKGYDVQPFALRATIAIGSLRQPMQKIFDLKRRIDKGEYAYPPVDLYDVIGGDTKYSVDAYGKPLVAVPANVVLQALEKDVKRHPHYECAIALLKAMANHYDDLEVVLYGE